MRCHRSRLLAGILMVELIGAGPAFGVTGDLVFADSFEPVNFRFTDLDLRDPHLFLSFISCNDITETLVNANLQTNIQTDGDGDGLYDLSYLQRLYPLNESDGAMGEADFVTANCSVATGACAADGSVPFLSTYTSQASGQCLGAIAGTVSHVYVPAIAPSTAPCFATATQTVTVNLAGVPLTLHNARVGATYVGNPATGLGSGLLTGFVTEADANATILPSSLPLIGGLPLSSLLAGGTGSCPAYSDKDVVGGITGWQFYLNFSATRVNYTE